MNITKEKIKDWVEENTLDSKAETENTADLIHHCIQVLTPKWVSVDNDLPITKADGMYLTRNVIATDGSDACEMMFTAGCIPNPWFEWSKYGDIVPEDITHWMPLPEPPK